MGSGVGGVGGSGGGDDDGDDLGVLRTRAPKLWKHLGQSNLHEVFHALVFQTNFLRMENSVTVSPSRFLSLSFFSIQFSTIIIIVIVIVIILLPVTYYILLFLLSLL